MASGQPPQVPAKLVLAATLTLLFLVAVGGALVLWAGWEGVLDALKRVGFLAVVVTLLTSLVGYFIRFLRWQLFLAALDEHVPWRRSLRIYISGFALTGTPGKAGELIRGVFLAREGVAYSRSFLLFFWDRLSDLAGVLLLAVIAVGWVSSNHTLLIPAVIIWVVAFWILRPGGRVFTTLVLLASRRLGPQRRRKVSTLVKLREADARMNKRLAASGVLAGACAYAMHGVGLTVLLKACGADLSIAAALLVVSISSLAGAAVLLPAGAGMVETTSVGILVALGVTAGDAVAIGLLHRATTFWFATTLGALSLATLAGRNRHGR